MAGPDAWWQRAKDEARAASTLRAVGQDLQAYHHAGQAAEFALKAIFMRRHGHSNMPLECRGAAWHSLTLIGERAGLKVDLDHVVNRRTLQANWLTVRDWDSNARFPGNTPPKEDIKDFFLAFFHKTDGVMKWLEDIYHSL